MLIGECITPPAPTQLQKKRPACIACRSYCPCGESHRPPGPREAAGRREKPPSAWGRGLAKAGRRAGFTPDCKKGPACIACRSYCPCGESRRPPGPREAAGRRGKPPSAGAGLGESRPEGRFHPDCKKEDRLASHAGPPPLRGKPQAAWAPRSRGAQGKAPFRGGWIWRKPAGGPVSPPIAKKRPACIACRSPALAGKATGRLGPAKPRGAGESPLPRRLDLAEAGRRAGSTPIAKKRTGLHRMPAPCPYGESYRSSASCTGCSSYMGTPV